MIQRFDRTISGAGSAEFLRWMRENSGGYFVNLNRPREGVLHRSSCPHMKFGEPETIDFVSRPKVVGNSRSELEAWAQEGEVALRPCSDCDV